MIAEKISTVIEVDWKKMTQAIINSLFVMY